MATKDSNGLRRIEDTDIAALEIEAIVAGDNLLAYACAVRLHGVKSDEAQVARDRLGPGDRELAEVTVTDRAEALEMIEEALDDREASQEDAE